MILEKSDRFYQELEDILNFISMDSPNRALKFYDDLVGKIEDIPFNPYIHRKRNFLNKNIDRELVLKGYTFQFLAENTRELIFKGYTVPFLIDKNDEVIIILGVFNQNLWE